MDEPNPRPGNTRRRVEGRLVRVEMLCADGRWRPLFCYAAPPAEAPAEAPCPACDGEGGVLVDAVDHATGVEYGLEERRCAACGGRGRRA